jgi:SET domain-containing protein
MIHPHTELKFICRKIGYGVVATRFIPKGTITYVMDALDQRFTEQEILELGPLYTDILDKYAYRDATGDYILCWDHARFINHSFYPNCMTTVYDSELAVRDIKPEEELTNDYGTLNVSDPFHCLPEKGANRKIVMPDDLLRFHDEWDCQLVSAFKHFLKGEQPLARFLPQKVYSKTVATANGECEMDSIVSCYCGPVQKK